MQPDCDPYRCPFVLFCMAGKDFEARVWFCCSCQGMFAVFKEYKQTPAVKESRCWEISVNNNAVRTCGRTAFAALSGLRCEKCRLD